MKLEGSSFEAQWCFLSLAHKNKNYNTGVYVLWHLRFAVTEIKKNSARLYRPEHHYTRSNRAFVLRTLWEKSTERSEALLHEVFPPTTGPALQESARCHMTSHLSEITHAATKQNNESSG